MATTVRHSYPLHELARVLNGRITATHENWCSALSDGSCNCGEPSYRLVRLPKGVRGR